MYFCSLLNTPLHLLLSDGWANGVNSVSVRLRSSRVGRSLHHPKFLHGTSLWRSLANDRSCFMELSHHPLVHRAAYDESPAVRKISFWVQLKNKERASYNGSIEASQASDVGSIPIARSINHRCFNWSYTAKLDLLNPAEKWTVLDLKMDASASNWSPILLAFGSREIVPR